MKDFHPKQIVYVSLISWIFLFIFSCKKEAGYGGDASIQGSVKIYAVNGLFTDTIAEYPGRDVYVYIRYGDHAGYDKRIKTDYEGNFLFDHLYTGDYQVYTYSADPLTPDGIKAVIKNITINNRKERVLLDTLNILQ